MPKAFISYSWDNEEHKNWVRGLAERLRSDGIEAQLDQWELVPGDELPKYMEESVREADFVLIVCTPRYKERSDSREGGVGYEGDIMTAEVLAAQNHRKFIPLWRTGPTWKDAAPSWLLGKYRLDFRGEAYPEGSYDDLMSTVLGSRPAAPPLGPVPGETPQAAAPVTRGADKPVRVDELDAPIRIVGVVVDEVGEPRNDGSRGSALYRVPFRLSRTPSPMWARLFPDVWNRPPSFTTMHRPGIAQVMGDRIILDGTTIEEVEKYHRDTLVLVVERVNELVEEQQRKEREAREQEAERHRRHQRKVSDIADRIKFD